MIRVVEVNGKKVEIFYKDGVEQSMKSAEAGVENIPFTEHFKKQVPILLPKGYNRDVYAILDAASKEDREHRPRVCMFCYEKDKPLLVQNSDGIPMKYWNVEMYRYQWEMTYTHYML